MTNLFDGLTVLAERAEGGAWRARLRIEPESRAFAGHFEGGPVLPGVALLVIVGHGLRALGRAGPLLLPWVKFRQVVRPGDVLDVVMETAADGRCRFEIRVADSLVAAGVADGSASHD